jgi:hypothetical protein
VPPAALRLALAEVGRPKSEIRSEKVDVRTANPAPAKKAGRPQAAPSWWTARAREGTVTPGFTKEEILKPAKEDPRAADGVFERVGGLLGELLEQG